MTDDELRDRITENPIAKQYWSRTSRPGVIAANREPWHALGMRFYAAWQILHAIENEKVELLGLEEWPRKERALLLRDTAEQVLDATPFLWANVVQDVADAAPLPKHVISPSVLAAPSMFWALETACIGETDGNGGLIEYNWIAAFHDVGKETPALAGAPDGGVLVIHDSTRSANSPNGRVVTGMALCFCRIPYGVTWPEHFLKLVAGAQDTKAAEMSIKGTGNFLKRCAFLASPYISKDPTRLARHHRRQLQRAGEPPEKVQERVHVVKLRREVKEQMKRAADAQPGSSSIEWKHQWWVTAHYRAQWYPSEEAHKVIWIAPYLKGPPDRPILEKVYAVVR